jgi:hypothetical protein
MQKIRTCSIIGDVRFGSVAVVHEFTSPGAAFGHNRTFANPQKYISFSSLPVFVDAVVSIVGQMENDMSKRRKASKGDSK